MADFCRDCLLLDSPEYADRNDMRGDLPIWTICEGCGTHIFNTDGSRVCQAVSWYENPDGMTPFGCPACAAFSEWLAVEVLGNA